MRNPCANTETHLSLASRVTNIGPFTGLPPRHALIETLSRRRTFFNSSKRKQINYLPPILYQAPPGGDAADPPSRCGQRAGGRGLFNVHYRQDVRTDPVVAMEQQS